MGNYIFKQEITSSLTSHHTQFQCKIQIAKWIIDLTKANTLEIVEGNIEIAVLGQRKISQETKSVNHERKIYKLEFIKINTSAL